MRLRTNGNIEPDKEGKRHNADQRASDGDRHEMQVGAIIVPAMRESARHG